MVFAVLDNLFLVFHEEQFHVVMPSDFGDDDMILSFVQ